MDHSDYVTTFPATSSSVHYTFDNGTGNFSCSHCHYITRWRTTMIVHQKRHTEDKPYWCDYCQAGFSHKSSLKRHLHNRCVQKMMMSLS